MKRLFVIWIMMTGSLQGLYGQQIREIVAFNFYGDTISFNLQSRSAVDFDENTLSDKSVQNFYHSISTKDFGPVFNALNQYREKRHPDDWLYYQLVRKTAQQISPKQENYLRYTLYKWYFMIRSGYSPLLSLHQNQLLFYIQCDENIYNIPARIKQGRQYVCLNYHDYGSNIDFSKTTFTEIKLDIPTGNRSFSYKIHKLPDFAKSDYVSKDLQFTMNENEYHFRIKVNPQVNSIFANYPTVDYADYFDIPLSAGTYASLIPMLKKQLKGLKTKGGVDYLMRFTRYAFVYEPDVKQFGAEKRLTPEQTLLYNGSDCEDRVFLFYYLVKEIYNLPMIALVYPQHVTIAVEFDKPVGRPIYYQGRAYSVCEPTPQSVDLNLGEKLPQLKNQTYEVVYVYNPVQP